MKIEQAGWGNLDNRVMKLSDNQLIGYSLIIRIPFVQWLFFALILIIAGCGPTLKQAYISDGAVQAEKEKQLEIAFDTHIKRQKRLYEVSFPLLAAAASMNIDDARQACGFMVCTKDSFPKEYREVAQRTFIIGDSPVVYFVHPKFPAAKAGLKPGDRLLNFNGNVLLGKSFKEVVNIINENQPSRDKPISMVIERQGQIIDLKCEGTLFCKYTMALIPHDQINALSDGKTIAVTNGLMRITENDDELAFVVAHEIAHNVLGHVGKKRGNILLGSVVDILLAATTGVYTGGTFGSIGGAAFSKGFEFEADYAGLYIAARAGRDVTGAVNFWRRLAAEHPKSMEKRFAATHPSTPERFVAMERTIQEIKEKQRLGKPLVPESKAKRSSEETSKPSTPE